MHAPDFIWGTRNVDGESFVHCVTCYDELFIGKRFCLEFHLQGMVARAFVTEQARFFMPLLLVLLLNVLH